MNGIVRSGEVVVISRDPNGFALRPKAFLGEDRFTAFRAAIAGATYDFDRKINSVQNIDMLCRAVDRLKASGFELRASEHSIVLEAQNHRNHIERAQQRAQTRLAAVDAQLKSQGLALYPFQREGVGWLLSRKTALLSDHPGLGKTIQTLVSIEENSATIVICPAIAKGVWLNETRKWRPDLRPTILRGRKEFRLPSPGELLIASYDSLPAYDPSCIENITHLICDEVHHCKNRHAQRTQRVTALAEAVRRDGNRVTLLTGTPLLNKPFDLWTVLSVAGLEREAFLSWKAFMAAFEGTQDEWGGTTFGTPTPAAAEGLQRVMLRRERQDVLPDLPVKTWRDVSVDLRSPEKKALDRVLAALGGQDELEAMDAEALQSIGVLSTARADLAKWKIPFLIRLVEDLEAQGEPCVVFSAHRAPIDALGERDGWTVITGDTTEKQRGDRVTAFQRDELRGIACTIAAGGVGITLTRAAHAIFVDLDWTPALNEQAEDRLLRIGQTRGVVITRLVAQHCVDEHVIGLLSEKRARIEGSVEAARMIGVGSGV